MSVAPVSAHGPRTCKIPKQLGIEEEQGEKVDLPVVAGLQPVRSALCTSSAMKEGRKVDYLRGQLVAQSP